MCGESSNEYFMRLFVRTIFRLWTGTQFLVKYNDSAFYSGSTWIDSLSLSCIYFALPLHEYYQAILLFPCVCLCICRKEIPNTKQWHVYFVLLWDCHQWSVGRIIFRVGFISHHWKVSFLIFFNKDFLVAVATREKFVIHTENMRNDFSIEFLCECVLWIESSMQHRKGKKSPVKISYYLHGNIFQLFFCQVSVCSIDWPHSVNHTHKFAHILCSLILPATGIRFQIQYLFYIHEIKPIIRIYIENTWILWLSLPLSENETESEENSTTLFLLLFYLHEQNWMCNTLLWSITNITFAASMMSWSYYEVGEKKKLVKIAKNSPTEKRKDEKDKHERNGHLNDWRKGELDGNVYI